MDELVTTNCKINNNSIDSDIIAESSIVLEEEKDNWGILYNPGTDRSYAINPVSVFIWKQLKKRININDLISLVKYNCSNVPDDVKLHVIAFIRKMIENGFVKMI